MDLNQRLRVRAALLEVRDLAPKRRVLLVARIDDLRLGPTLPRLETGKLAPIACGSPRDEMRGLQSLATKKSADLASLRAGLDLLQDLLFVRRREVAPRSLRGHLRHGDGG